MSETGLLGGVLWVPQYLNNHLVQLNQGDRAPETAPPPLTEAEIDRVIHSGELFCASQKPPFGPVHVGVITEEFFVAEDSPSAPGDVGAGGDAHTADDGVSVRDARHDACDGWPDAEALLDTRLEERKLPCLGVGDWGRYLPVRGSGVDLGLQAPVNKGVCDDVDQR